MTKIKRSIVAVGKRRIKGLDPISRAVSTLSGRSVVVYDSKKTGVVRFVVFDREGIAVECESIPGGRLCEDCETRGSGNGDVLNVAPYYSAWGRGVGHLAFTLVHTPRYLCGDCEEIEFDQCAYCDIAISNPYGYDEEEDKVICPACAEKRAAMTPAEKEQDAMERSWGYKKLLEAVVSDETKSPGFHNYHAKFDWIVDRAKHYASVTGIGADEILDSWEKRRDYWYMNYYQDSNQPVLSGEQVRVFDTDKDLMESIGRHEFRCPKCNGVSQSPYECTCKGCDWKGWGLFGNLGKGVFVFCKERVKGEKWFMPISWELAAARGDR